MDDLPIGDEGLLRAWRAAVRAAGARSDDPDGAAETEIDAAGRALLARWREPHRRYHDDEHLTDTLAAVDLLAAHARDLPVVRLAVWFHDAVHAGRPGDDEEASAVLAEQVLGGLGVPGPAVADVARLVRMTARHVPPPDDPDGAVLSDADLAVLAAPADRYARYARDVRAEYAHVPDGAFRAGRTAVLRALAGQDPLFRTATGRSRWEGAARANLAAEIAALAAARSAD